jgi:hypothetical protein
MNAMQNITMQNEAHRLIEEWCATNTGTDIPISGGRRLDDEDRAGGFEGLRW